MRRGRRLDEVWRRGGRFDCSIDAMKTRWRAAAVLNAHLELRMVVVFCVVKVESYCSSFKYTSPLR